MRLQNFVFAVTLIGFFFGCDSDRPPLAHVSGNVTFGGAPLQQGTIIFDVAGQRQATGKIQDGRIVEVTTYEHGDGVPIGHARIAVFSNDAHDWQPPATLPASPAEWTPESVSPMTSPSGIPPKYNNPQTSGLTLSIEPGTNELVVELAE